MSSLRNRQIRVAFVVSHPVQYYVPLYRLLSKNPALECKVFYTWHGGSQPQFDKGFERCISWDIPLTGGYQFEVIPNTASRPGTDHYGGLKNPTLLPRLLSWKPDVVHLTGYYYHSHLRLIYQCHKLGLPLLFRGDSHLLDDEPFWKAMAKHLVLRSIFRLPQGFLCVGKSNTQYYKHFGVPEEKLFACPHSIDVSRFSSNAPTLEAQAAVWRQELGLTEGPILLFAGKFEAKKRPLPLMRAFIDCAPPSARLLMIGDGPLGADVKQLASQHPNRMLILPFQNQSRMPLVYRLCDLFILPSGCRETWGLAVNEAMSCGRPVLVSNRVGCAADVVSPGVNGGIFTSDNWQDFKSTLLALLLDAKRLSVMGANARKTAALFDIPVTASTLVDAIRRTLNM